MIGLGPRVACLHTLNLKTAHHFHGQRNMRICSTTHALNWPGMRDFLITGRTILWDTVINSGQLNIRSETIPVGDKELSTFISN